MAPFGRAIILYAFLVHLADAFFLNEHSFSLRSTVKVLLSQRYAITSRVVESYSQQQRRAKLEFQTESSKDRANFKQVPLSGTFYLDKSGLGKYSSLLIDSSNLKCNKWSLNDFLRDNLFLDLGDLTLEREEDSFAPSYLVGPARVAAFVMTNEEKMKLDSGEVCRVKNVACKLYKFEESGLKFSVYMGESFAAGVDKQTLPLQVKIEKGALDSDTILIDYSKLELFEENLSGETREKVSMNLAFDRLMVEPNSGCYEVLAAEGKQVELFESRSESDKFSFTLQTDFSNFASGKISVKSFVAFDGRLESMVYHLLGSREVEPSHYSGVRKQLFNFKTNRMYHVMEKVREAKQYTTIDRILELSDEANLDRSGRMVSTQCAVSEIEPSVKWAANEGKRRFSLSELLLGSNSFVYLGKAEVRGLRASVYETTTDLEKFLPLPFWLEQPIKYWRYRGGWEEVLGYGDQAFKLDIVVYMADSELKSEQVVLMMEVYRISGGTFWKQTIHFYDFAWEINHMPPNGEPINDLFSVHNYCSNDLSSGFVQYAQVEMLLEAESNFGQVAKRQLESGSFRNLALEASIQESFKLPASMIFDLESKFLERPARTNKNQEGRRKDLISVSFKLAEHYNKLVDFYMLGMGKPNLRYRGPRVDTNVRSLQACAMQAAHVMGSCVFFGYHLTTRSCSIDLAPLAGGVEISENLTAPAFTMSSRPSGPDQDPSLMSVFITGHQQDDSIADEVSAWLNNLNRLNRKVYLINTALQIRDIRLDDGAEGAEDATRSNLKFELKQIHLSERSRLRRLAKGAAKVNLTRPAVYGDRLPEFGLSQEDHDYNKLLDPAKLDANNWRKSHEGAGSESYSRMTLDQCRAACLDEPECRSFSVCFVNNEIECILSKVDFRSELIVKQIGQFRAERGKFTVDLGPSQAIHLLRRQNCEIINKNYLDLYRKPEKIKFVYSDRQVMPVENEEACAELCTTANMDFMQRQSLLANTITLSAKRRLQLISAQTYRAFLYISRNSLNEQLEDEFQANILPAHKELMDQRTPEEAPLEGYCIVGQTASEEETKLMSDIIHQRERQNVLKSLVKMDIYYFRYEHFYRKFFGVRLLPSSMSGKELDAYSTVRTLAQKLAVGTMNYEEIQENAAHQEAIKTIELYVGSDRNIRTEIWADESNCAKHCFLQTYTPWPVCRSFDLVVETFPGTDIKRVKCYLNTITIDDVLRTNQFDLIDEGVANESVSTVRWHYEVRSGAPKNQINLESLFSGEILKTIFRELQKQQNVRVHILGVLIISLLGISLGLLVGFRFGPKLAFELNRRLGGSQSEEQRGIVEEGELRVDFENQVDSAGRIS